MKLNKRYMRSIKSNRSFYVSSTILTITTLVLFFTMYMAGAAIKEFGEKFFESQRVEDANFTTYLPISDEERSDLEKKYDVEIEPQYYANVDTDGTTARVYKKTKKIDLYDVTVGEDVKADDEIIISEGYAVFNEISTGDKMKVGDKEYKVTGFFQRPDYLYMLQNEGDAYKNVTTFFLAYVTDEEFENIGSRNCLYLIRYEKDNNIEFRKEVNENYIMRSYMSADDNIRIYMVPMQADMFIVMSYLILVILPLIVVILVSVIISRKVKSEQKMIGTLTALGYTKGRLMMHYAGFAMIPGILGGVISVILSVIFAQPFGELGLQDYEPMRIECHMNPWTAVLAIVVPTLMYVLASIRAVAKLLKKDTVLLLNANSDQQKIGLKKILVKKKISFRIKYALRSLIGNPGRTFVVFLGIFLGSYIFLLGFSMWDAMDATGNNMGDVLGSYNYQYVLGELVDEDAYDGELLLSSVLENDEGKQISLIGTRNENPYLDLKDLDGNSVDLSKGYYITHVIAILNDVKTGDEMTYLNPLTLEEHTIKVEGIIDSSIQSAIYTDREHVAKLTGIDASLSNVIMSDVELDIPSEKVLQVMKKIESKDQFENMTNQMDLMVYLVIILGGIICISAIYVAVNMLISENSTNISMLKVLGYDEKMINGIVLRVNHVMLPIGIAVSIPLVYASVDWCFKWLAEYIGVIIESYIAPLSFVYTILFTCASYFLSLLLLRRKVSKVDMVESLKDNRE